jgi:hypothetical protein
MPFVEKNGDREMGKQRAERMGHRVERDEEGGGLEGGSGTRRRSKRNGLCRDEGETWNWEYREGSYKSPIITIRISLNLCQSWSFVMM